MPVRWPFFRIRFLRRCTCEAITGLLRARTQTTGECRRQASRENYIESSESSSIDHRNVLPPSFLLRSPEHKCSSGSLLPERALNRLSVKSYIRSDGDSFEENGVATVNGVARSSNKPGPER
jgi:hypothetical protein